MGQYPCPLVWVWSQVPNLAPVPVPVAGFTCGYTFGAGWVCEGEGEGVNESEAARHTQICVRHTWRWVCEGEGERMKQCDARKCACITLSHPHIWR